MFKLLRHFSVVSAIATAAITTVLLIGFRLYENKNLLRTAEDRNVAQAQSFANSISMYEGFLLRPRSATEIGRLSSDPVIGHIDSDLRQLTRNLSILKVKIYTPSGLTVYSSDFNQIGDDKGSDANFKRLVEARRGVTKFGNRDVLNSFEADFKSRFVAESYVPITDEAGNVKIVYEIYSDLTAHVGQVERWFYTSMALLVAALGALYVLLMLVVRRADRILIRQYDELQTFSLRLEEKVDERTRRLLNQQSVLSWITKSDEFRSGDFETAVQNLTRVTAATLEVQRVSIWMFSADRDWLRCVDLYCAKRGDHSSARGLEVDRYPIYFSTLFAHEQVAFDDAQADERLSEFRELYLQPLGIGSMLDVPVVHGGRIEGVLCIEHVGAPIKWTAEQKLFGIAIANFASLAMERQERLRAEEGLREANRSVEAANKAKSLFLANMSHEIRTPMNGVFGMTDLLMRTELSERQRKFVGIISGSAKRLLTIINDILDLSRIESGKLELDQHDFPLRSMVEETIDLLAGEAQRKGLELSLLVAGDVPEVVKGDSGRLRQVITNLVSNAIKFTRSGEVAVRIGCHGTDNGAAAITFQVRDTGIGISEDVQQQLFKPFQQADTSISRRFGGTGLGLSISRHLIELMGGQVELKSETGVGTTVRFKLNLKIAGAGGREVGKPGNSAELASCRVLVLDDRATNREVIESYFSDWGARTHAAASANEAIDLMVRAKSENDAFGLVVVDMLMPDVNGLEFAQLVRDEPMLAGTGLIMLTSLSWKGDVRAARELGFGAFLTKPVHRDELYKAARVVMSRRHVETKDLECASDEAGGSMPPKLEFGLKVLVAEDNPVNFEVAREYLEGLGCTVGSAENGRLAFEAVRDGCFDLVLMDCQMPEMDGLTATRLIRKLEKEARLPRTPIVAVTANAFAEDKAQCLEVGMDDYMSKPFSEEQLQELLARWAPKIKAADASAATDAANGSGATAPSMGLGGAAVPVEPEAVAKALDIDVLRRMQKTHPTLAGRLVDTYMSYAPKAIQQLLAAMVAEDIAQLKLTSHSLKSSSANIGAMHLSGLCRELEGRMKDATSWDAGANLASVAQIEQAFQAVAAALGPLQAELKAAQPAAKASA